MGNSRVKKMKARDELLEQLKRECVQQLATISQGAKYEKLLKDLIVQGLIKIQEETVEIQCRPEDVSRVQKLVRF